MIIDKNTVMVFQGDSITHGGRSGNSDRNHMMGHGFQNLIASRLGAEHFTEMPDFINRGVSGDNICSMFARWRETLCLEPTAINILIGVNDAHTAYTADGNGTPVHIYERTFRNIIEDTYEVLPDVKFILCEPFYLKWKDEERSAYMYDKVLQYAAVVKKLADEYRLPFVGLQSMFEEKAKYTVPEYLVWDEVHPTVYGHQMIADKWFETMKNCGEL